MGVAQAADVEAENADALRPQRVGADLLIPGLRGIAERKKPALEAQQPQALRPRGAGDGIDDHVELAGISAGKRVAEPHLVIPEVEGNLAFLLRADHPHDPARAKQPRNLAELGAEPSRRGLHQHMLARLNAHGPLQGGQGGRGVRGNDRRQRGIHPGRQRDGERSLRQSHLPVAARAQNRDRRGHRFADRQSFHAFAKLADAPRRFDPRSPRQRPRGQTLREQRLDIVRPRIFDVDRDLTPRRPGDRRLLIHEALGACVARDLKSLHDCSFRRPAVVVLGPTRVFGRMLLIFERWTPPLRGKAAI